MRYDYVQEEKKTGKMIWEHDDSGPKSRIGNGLRMGICTAISPRLRGTSRFIYGARSIRLRIDTTTSNAWR